MTNAAHAPAVQTPSGRTVIALIVWFTVSTVSALGFLSLQGVTGLDPAVLSLVMLAPAVGAAVAWVVTRGGIPKYPTKVGPAPLLIALALSLVAVAVYFVVISVMRGSAPQVPGEVAGVPVLLVIAAQILGALGEEIGFRGVLLHSLTRWISRPWAAVVTGVVFGFWHIQYYALPPLQLGAFIVGAVALTVTMASVMVGGFWQQMAMCTVIHAGANLALAFVDTDSVPMTMFSVAIIVGAVVVIPFAVWRLHRRKPA